MFSPLSDTFAPSTFSVISSYVSELQSKSDVKKSHSKHIQYLLWMKT